MGSTLESIQCKITSFDQTTGSQLGYTNDPNQVELYNYHFGSFVLVEL